MQIKGAILINANVLNIKLGTPVSRFRLEREIVVIFYLKHTKGKGIFSNFSLKLFYGNLCYEIKVYDFPNI